MRIAILGAECTGKSTLAQALTSRFHTPTAPWALAAEYLRDWCDQHQRTPNRTEQQTIAEAQVQRVDALAANGASVVADTTALMTAIYSDVLFQDDSLYAAALKHQRSYDLTLVTGTDLPWVADGFQRDSAVTRATIDRKLRFVLQSHKIDHTVIYGLDEGRIQCALESVAHRKKKPLPRSAHDTDWKWSCDSCSDPECEHRLFSRLLSAH
jgi:HTH-type transcriptional regulator, transcriptional repressor of NAD biosynthesis genes